MVSEVNAVLQGEALHLRAIDTLASCNVDFFVTHVLSEVRGVECILSPPAPNRGVVWEASRRERLIAGRLTIGWRVLGW